ncbi:MAG: HlyD family secretion protein [Bradyrhizobium sp.]|uniref:efflux RND transporter periplasmic adaptor subunit n=1 Tax=Bradyrhizobium sp. TaxID=376 RepID=UPI0025C4FD92|nr:HlyD family secretion protein [Bradyrhizobium sp.]MBI5264020.1 HlyD family secretion protein [Bradyrhizobium sp.]
MLCRATFAGALGLAAVWTGYTLSDNYTDEPPTGIGHVRADAVPVAPCVSGFVTEVLVSDNQFVKRGEVLFWIDRAAYVIALQQADAVLEERGALLEQADAEFRGYGALTPESGASKPMIDQVTARQNMAKTAYEQALVERNLAQLNLECSGVRASIDGIVTKADLRPGTYVAHGKAAMALLDREALHVEAYFDKDELSRIHPGDTVNVLLIGSNHILRGHVESSATGVEEGDRSGVATLLAEIKLTFNWVRVTQPVPVRIALDDTEDRSHLVAGRAAIVEVLGPTLKQGSASGANCKPRSVNNLPRA